MLEAGISAPSMGLFPYKTEMKIYNNGQITVGDVVCATDPNIPYFDKNMDFNSAPFMKIMGDKFRIVTIKMSDVKSDLYTGQMNDLRKFDLSEVRQWKDDPNKEIPYVYARISLGDFKGSEKEFLALTDEILIALLQDPAKLHDTFNDSLFIYYKKNKKDWLAKIFYFDLGNVMVEQIEGDYYQQVTQAVKIISAPRAGTVGSCSLKKVAAKDFLIWREDQAYLNCITKGKRAFIAKLCNQNGQILSDQIYEPGNDLPTLNLTALSSTSAIAKVISLPQINRMSHANEERVATQLGVKDKEVTRDPPFVDDLGADSLDTVDLVIPFEDEQAAHQVRR